MKISYLKLKPILEIINKNKRDILIEVDTLKEFEKPPYREKYRSFLFMSKLLNHFINRKIYFNKRELYFKIKSETINYGDKKPFYKILTMIEEIQ